MDMKTSRVYFTAVLFLTAVLALGGFLYFSDKNSSEISPGSPTSKNLDLEAQPPKTPNLEASLPSKIKLLFLGDIMLDRYIRRVAQKHGYDFVFGDTDNILKNNDLVIGNLEGPITDNNSKSINSEFESRDNYVFTFAPETAVALNKHNIKLVNLGNNHILNFGEGGLEQTKKYLKESEIGYFCDPDNPELRVANYKLQGLKIAFVCYNQFEKGAAERAERDIREVKGKVDIVILYTHWGKEYETSILPIIRILGHKFVDAGADLIIGSHPHVVQEKEIYNGKTIYYSLGNFIFDQYFNPNAAKGLAVEVIINPGENFQFIEHQIQMKINGQTVLKK